MLNNQLFFAQERDPNILCSVTGACINFETGECLSGSREECERALGVDQGVNWTLYAGIGLGIAIAIGAVFLVKKKLRKTN